INVYRRFAFYDPFQSVSLGSQVAQARLELQHAAPRQPRTLFQSPLPHACQLLGDGQRLSGVVLLDLPQSVSVRKCLGHFISELLAPLKQQHCAPEPHEQYRPPRPAGGDDRGGTDGQRDRDDLGPAFRPQFTSGERGMPDFVIDDELLRGRQLVKIGIGIRCQDKAAAADAEITSAIERGIPGIGHHVELPGGPPWRDVQIKVLKTVNSKQLITGERGGAYPVPRLTFADIGTKRQQGDLAGIDDRGHEKYRYRYDNYENEKSCRPGWMRSKGR